MTATIDKAGRVVIPVAIREQLGLVAGTKLEVEVDGFGLRLRRTAPGPELVKVDGRWVARPRGDAADLPAVDPAALVDEERDRWPTT